MTVTTESVARRAIARPAQPATTPDNCAVCGQPITNPKHAAALYTRISDDREGKELGVARQREDGLALIHDRDLHVAERHIYVENDIGASTRSRKPRPQYAAMLKAARDHEVATLAAYSNSRLTRRPREMEDLIELFEKHGTKIITKVSGEDDLETADGRMVARIKASIDAGEAERTGERVKRAHLQSAQRGKVVGGRRPFGWKADRITIDAREAELIKDAAAQVIAGVPLRRIVADWNDQGVPTVFGATRWDHRTLRHILRSPRLAGWRVYKDKIAEDRDHQPVRGQQEAILDQDTHLRVVARLTRPDKRARIPRQGARRYLLTGTVRCGVCNSIIYGNANNKTGKFYYTCTEGTPKHVLSASGEKVDKMINAAMREWLGQAKIATPEPAPFHGDERLREIGEQIAELMAAYREKRLSASIVFGTVADLEAERDELGAERQAYEADLADRSSGPTEMTPEDWDALSDDLDRKRAIIGRHIEAVIIQPATKRTNKFDEDRVEILPRRRS